MVAMDGTSSRVIDLNPLWPLDVSFGPPNGDRLLLRARDAIGEGVDLYTLKPDGTDLHPLDLPGTTVFGPTYTLSGAQWAPDGTTIAYNGIDVVPGMFDEDGRPLEHFRLHLVSPDGSSDRAVPGPDDPRVQENWPLYSPDGEWIVAQRWSFDSRVGGLAILPADGTQAARPIGPQNVGGDLGKAWSPDGTRILMRVQDTTPGQVFAIDPVTGEYEELTWTTGMPDWQRVAR